MVTKAPTLFILWITKIIGIINPHLEGFLMRYKNKIDGKLYSIIKYANRRVVLQAECGAVWITTLKALNKNISS